jgi:hypothetical protein
MIAATINGDGKGAGLPVCVDCGFSVSVCDAGCADCVAFGDGLGVGLRIEFVDKFVISVFSASLSLLVLTLTNEGKVKQETVSKTSISNKAVFPFISITFTGLA